MTQTQEQNVPALRFPEFSGEWKTDRLINFDLAVIDGDRGTNYPQKTDFSSTGYCLFLNAKNVTKSGFSFEDTSFISQTKDTAMSKGKLHRGDILLTTRGSVGHIALFDEAVVYENIRINSGMVILRPAEGADVPSFLFFLFNSPKVTTQIKRIAFGSAQPQLTVKEIKRFWLTKPDAPEQQKIAAFLSSVDRRIAQLGQKKALLQRYKKGMMQKLFSQELRFKDAQGHDFSDWEEKRLGEVADVNPKAAKLPDVFIYIDLESVVSGALVRESKIQKSGAPSRAQRLLKKGDVLFQTVRPYQKNNYIFFKDGDYVASTGYAQLRAEGSPNFLYQILHTGSFVNKVLARCTGTSYPAINSNDLAKVHFQFPTLPEQQKIAEFLSSIDRKIDLVSTELDHSKAFKKGLLQLMFV